MLCLWILEQEIKSASPRAWKVVEFKPMKRGSDMVSFSLRSAEISQPQIDRRVSVKVTPSASLIDHHFYRHKIFVIQNPCKIPVGVEQQTVGEFTNDHDNADRHDMEVLLNFRTVQGCPQGQTPPKNQDFPCSKHELVE